MMKKITFFMLSMVLATMFSTEAFASSNKYAKCVVESTGNGTVYVSTTDDSSGEYGKTSQASNYKNNTGNASIDFFRFTKPAEGYAFAGWYSDKACTQNRSFDRKVTISANSTSQNSPTTNTYYAKFIKNICFDNPKDWTTSDVTLNPVTEKNADGWTINHSEGWHGIATFEIGSTALLNNVAVPSLGAKGETEGGVMGVSCSWTGHAAYEKDLYLNEGVYEFSYDAYEANANATDGIEKNLTGVILDNGVEYLSTKTAYTLGEWSHESIRFTITEATVAKISAGYKSKDITSNETPKLFIDNVTLRKLDKVTMTVGAAGYGTFVAPFEVAELPEGVKAYTVSDADGDVLELTEVETIDANTPVVLEGECNQECYGVAAPETAEYGMLVGVYEDTQAPVGSYVLQKHGEVVGFYQVGSETTPTVKANRAYLNAPVSEVRAFFFDSETAIRSVEALTSGKSQIFDLNGRRLNRMQKGINIVNGVKILVK